MRTGEQRLGRRIVEAAEGGGARARLSESDEHRRSVVGGILVASSMNVPGGDWIRKRKRNRRRIQDLNVPPEEQQMAKRSLGEGSTNFPANTIILEDDEDDDVQVSSPQSVARARLGRMSTSSSSRRQRGMLVDFFADEECLELRLGRPGAAKVVPSHAGAGPHLSGVYVAMPKESAEDCIVLGEKVLPPKKVQREAEPVKLTCSICLDQMKEEMSTVCGHLFCRDCILGAIRAQKRCPTCRRKLSPREAHRIYI